MAGIDDVERLIEEEEEEFGRAIERPKVPSNKKEPPTLKTLLVKDQDRTLKRTGLNLEQFTFILALLEGEATPMRRGPKLPDLGLRLVITLQWLRLGPTYEELADAYSMSTGRIQTAITSLWDPLCKVLSGSLLPKRPRDYKPTRTFKNFPNAIGALDATLIATVKPADRAGNDAWSSGEHQCHRARLQVLSAPDGTVTHLGGIVPGRGNGKYHLIRAMFRGHCHRLLQPIMVSRR